MNKKWPLCLNISLKYQDSARVIDPLTVFPTHIRILYFSIVHDVKGQLGDLCMCIVKNQVSYCCAFQGYMSCGPLGYSSL